MLHRIEARVLAGIFYGGVVKATSKKEGAEAARRLLVRRCALQRAASSRQSLGPPRPHPAFSLEKPEMRSIEDACHATRQPNTTRTRPPPISRCCQTVALSIRKSSAIRAGSPVVWGTPHLLAPQNVRALNRRSAERASGASAVTTLTTAPPRPGEPAVQCQTPDEVESREEAVIPFTPRRGPRYKSSGFDAAPFCRGWNPSFSRRSIKCSTTPASNCVPALAIIVWRAISLVSALRYGLSVVIAS